jgi:hypothetical protein
MLYKGQLNELIRLAEIDASNLDLLKEKITDGLSVIWSLDELKLMLTEESSCSSKFDFIFNRIQSRSLKSNHARLIHFNRAFYCIADHDSEVGCKGFLFFASHSQNNNTR